MRLRRRRRQLGIVASGGFIVPVGSTNEFRLFRDVMPAFTAKRGGIDFTPPHVKWARQRERELRASRRMWDWP